MATWKTGLTWTGLLQRLGTLSTPMHPCLPSTSTLPQILHPQFHLRKHPRQCRVWTLSCLPVRIPSTTFHSLPNLPSLGSRPRVQTVPMGLNHRPKSPKKCMQTTLPYKSTSPSHKSKQRRCTQNHVPPPTRPPPTRGHLPPSSLRDTSRITNTLPRSTNFMRVAHPHP